MPRNPKETKNQI